MAKHTTEQVYDEQMAPLVRRLIEIANANKIPLFLSAGMIMPDGRPGCSTTLVGTEGCDPKLSGAVNRYGFCASLVRGPASLDTANRIVWFRTAEPIPKPVGDA